MMDKIIISVIFYIISCFYFYTQGKIAGLKEAQSILERTNYVKKESKHS
jgi:hypothetical protein